jgi:hypothetical protein
MENKCDINELVTHIMTYVELHKGTYVNIDNNDDIIKIHDCLYNDIICDNVSDIVNLYYGFYYNCKKDHLNTIKYYELAMINIKQAVWNIACCYQTKKDYVNMIKYHMINIEQCNNEHSMYQLGKYYNKINDYSNSMKYYLLAAKNGHIKSINEVVIHCSKNKIIEPFILLYQQNYFITWVSLDEKLFLINTIASFLKNKLISRDLVNIIADIDISGCDHIDPLFKLVKNLLSAKVDLIDLHFNYSPDSDGCKKAKNDFMNRLI